MSLLWKGPQGSPAIIFFKRRAMGARLWLESPEASERSQKADSIVQPSTCPIEPTQQGNGLSTSPWRSTNSRYPGGGRSKEPGSGGAILHSVNICEILAEDNLFEEPGQFGRRSLNQGAQGSHLLPQEIIVLWLGVVLRRRWRTALGKNLID